MDKDLRASLSAAGAAAALSALVGIIAGVGFLTLLLRALGFGLVAGAAVFGAIVLLRRTLPEIVESPRNAESGGAGDEMGLNVDIVLPGEAPDFEAAEAVGLAVEPRRGLKREAGRQASLPDEEEPAPAYGDGDGEEGEDVSELEDASLLEPEDGEVVEPAIPSAAAPSKEKRSGVGFDELDMLPDLDGFTDSFTASEFAYGGTGSGAGYLAEGADRSTPRASGGGAASSMGVGSGTDPAALAQAVRTILKRDQKG